MLRKLWAFFSSSNQHYSNECITCSSCLHCLHGNHPWKQKGCHYRGLMGRFMDVYLISEQGLDVSEKRGCDV